MNVIVEWGLNNPKVPWSDDVILLRSYFHVIQEARTYIYENRNSQALMDGFISINGGESWDRIDKLDPAWYKPH
jgi:hypothetical protein